MKSKIIYGVVTSVPYVMFLLFCYAVAATIEQYYPYF